LARPSRIRREPPPVEERRALRPHPTEQEVHRCVIGVLLFALAIAIVILGVSDFTNR
jgi:hypothetical protein